ncbi:hypothetical protein M0R88_04440 [Halorussus gelatinilyticus]|uniref:Nucleotide modification associated domain-containing protein n=1 Tax=Halorussus gelatinilyticus TaxID=2937524 RepID=A0A8U0IL01_9EURY|nr:hypothetical protein [Halorussus gelatinilyticus]UPW01356.1 hypothetical protein M0R88_04440 [Halorussus gelatinilyticus]
MPRAVAINVGANTNAPGVRGPIYPDGRFEFVPIPEESPTGETVPTYADLDLDTQLPEGAADAPVHLDPEFAEYPECEAYTYGDPHGVKARPLLDLREGDYALFYATLTTRGTPERDWISPEWGAYLVGQFRLARDPVAGDAYPDLPADERRRFRNNAHVKREEFDAAVLLAGDDEESGLYETAVPLSSPEQGATANRLVTDLSSDSGKGPWWRRPMKFGEPETAELLELVADGDE